MIEEIPASKTKSLPSNREFGFVMTGFFALIGILIPLIRTGSIHTLLTAIAVVFFAVALTIPRILTIPNRAWMTLGHVLSKIVSPLVIGLLYFAVFAPMGFILRHTKRDFFSLKIDRARESYWIRRDSATRSSMKNQF